MMKTFILTLCSLLLALGLLAQREIIVDQPIEKPIEQAIDRETIRKKLEDVATEGKTLEQIKTARIAKWQLSKAAEQIAHRREMAKDLVADLQRPDKPPPGRPGGIRVRLVWTDTAAWDAWDQKFDGIPRLKGGFAMDINNPTYEIAATYDEDTGEQLTPPSGRRYTEIQARLPVIHWLEAQGVTVYRAGGFDPLTFDETP